MRRVKGAANQGEIFWWSGDYVCIHGMSPIA